MASGGPESTASLSGRTRFMGQRGANQPCGKRRAGSKPMVNRSLMQLSKETLMPYILLWLVGIPIPLILLLWLIFS